MAFDNATYGLVNPAFNIGVGTSVAKRVGLKIFVHSIRLRFKIEMSGNNSIRYIVL